MENDFLSLIITCRSVRVYQAETVPAEALDTVLEAGTYAPTGGGCQSPTIIAITDPKYRQEIAKLNAEVMGSSTDPYYGASVVVLVLADGGASTFVEDGSYVLENICWPPMPLTLELYGCIGNASFLTAKKERLSCGSGSCRTLCGEEEKYADQ